jgi:choline dehydrogenase-like flavoprotein
MSCFAIAYLRDESLLLTQEFQDLDYETRKFLTKKEVPHFEFLNALPAVFPGLEPEDGHAAHMMFSFVHNAQSSGSVTLRSKDPNDKPVIDVNYLDHPYDRKVLIHMIRESMKFVTETSIKKSFEKFILAPQGVSDEEILVRIFPSPYTLLPTSTNSMV